MSKHTPGPWKWADGYRGLFNKETLEDVLGYQEYEGLWPSTPAKPDGREIKAANCRLIRAAPDLLKALQDWEFELSRRYGELHPGVVEVRAAIAKATKSPD